MPSPNGQIIIIIEIGILATARDGGKSVWYGTDLCNHKGMMFVVPRDEECKM